MLRGHGLLVVVAITMSGLSAFATSPANQSGLNADHRGQALRESYNQCKTELAELKKTKPDTDAAVIKKESRCEVLEYRLDPSCKDETKTAHEALAKFTENCMGAGFEDLNECLRRARSNETNCAKLAVQGRRTSDQSGTFAEMTRMISDFQSDRGRSSTSSGGANACIKYSLTEFNKMKAEHEKNLAAIETDIVKAQQALADRKKNMNDQIAKLAERRSEAQRKFQENSDKANQAASQEAMQVMNQAQRFEADKAKATVELYEPKMKKTQAYADEKVALKPFSDIRALCVAELRKKMITDGVLYKNSSDQFTASTQAKNTRERVYWECVETYQTQVRAIKRSHQQARQGYDEQVRLIENRIADIDKAKQAAQKAQADASARVAASSKRLAEVLEEQMTAMKKETENAEAALKKNDEDHAKQMASLEKRKNELHSDIQQLGAPPVGDKKLSDAKASHITFVAAYNAVKDRDDCKVPVAGIKRTVEEHRIPLTNDVDENRRGTAADDRDIRVNEPESLRHGGRGERDEYGI